MRKCCVDKPITANPCDPCNPPEVNCFNSQPSATGPLAWFEDMINHCLDYAEEAKKNGRPVIGIACEFAPRELILAAGGVPVCLCGGSAETIPAAEEHLPSGVCPLIKSTYGYHVENKNPFIEMADLIIAETTCDGKKKMFELMAEHRPMYMMELPQKQDDLDAFEHWVKELQKLKCHLEELFGVHITNDKLREAIFLMNEERSLRRKLAELMKSSNPPITGRQLLDLKSTISGISEDLDQYKLALKEYGSGGGNGSHSKVRVLLTGVPVVHGAERVVDIIEDSGGLIVCQENCTGLKPILEDVDPDADDLIRALAEKYFNINCSVMTRNTRRFELIKQLAAEYNAQCIVDLIWQGCITYDVESFQIKRLAESLGLPYMRVETDYSPSDSARISVRIEALYETVKNNAGACCVK